MQQNGIFHVMNPNPKIVNFFKYSPHSPFSSKKRSINEKSLYSSPNPINTEGKPIITKFTRKYKLLTIKFRRKIILLAQILI